MLNLPQIDKSIAGILLLVGQIADGIATPFVGSQCDKGFPPWLKYGKRKTWHMIGMVLVRLKSNFDFISINLVWFIIQIKNLL